jgi:HSP20 family protein
MEQGMNRFWRGLGVGEEVEGWALPLDVVHEGDNVVVQASLPGVKPEDIEITVEDGVLSIKGDTQTESEESTGGYLLRERRTGKFRRSLRLPDSVDADQAEPKYENGVLTVTFPKIEAKKAKRLEIKSG